MFYQLPPVGNPVCLTRTGSSEALLQVFGAAYQPHYFSSGTAALAAAITASIELKAVEKPEVLLPAYGCPDLISAAVFAGAKPVLVDLQIDRPWMDLEQVSAKINRQTVAIIAVNLFGISERLTQLRDIAERENALLIEDSAQAFPGNKEKDIWQGDLVVLSFGRGKPVSLLGGGAVLVRSDALDVLLQKRNTQIGDGVAQRVSYRLKAMLYNRMISPWLYWLPQSLPFLHLGETHYYPLPSIEGMDKLRLSILPTNIKSYQDDSMDAQNNLVTMLGKLDLEECGITDLPKICVTPENRRLLRYPLLVKTEIREQLYTGLQRIGLGASRMYPTILPDIPGLESLLKKQGTFPAATSFSDRLLTLPTHSRVSQTDINKMSHGLSH